MRSLFLTVLILALLPSAFITPFIGVLVWSWISFMSPHRLVWGIGDSLPWAVIVGGVGIAGWLVSERRRIPMDATTVLLALLAVLFTISTYYSLVPDLAWVKWEAILKEFVFFFITAALVTNRVRVHALMWIMVISISYYGIKGGVFTLLTGGNYRVWGPDMSEIADNNQLAAALVMVLPLMNYLGRQSKNEMLRFGSRISMGFCLLSILASYSRGAFVALAAMVLWLWRHTRHKLISAVVIGGTLAGAVTFMPSRLGRAYQLDSELRARRLGRRPAADLGNGYQDRRGATAGRGWLLRAIHAIGRRSVFARRPGARRALDLARGSG